MARTKTVTPEALAALGAEALAEALITHAATDPVLRKKLGMLLAGTEGPGKLAAEIDKRIKTIGRSRSFVDWEKRKPLVHELDHLRVTMATRLARQDAARAVELLWDFIGSTSLWFDQPPEPVFPSMRLLQPRDKRRVALDRSRHRQVRRETHAGQQIARGVLVLLR